MAGRAKLLELVQRQLADGERVLASATGGLDGSYALLKGSRGILCATSERVIFYIAKVGADVVKVFNYAVLDSVSYVATSGGSTYGGTGGVTTTGQLAFAHDGQMHVFASFEEPSETKAVGEAVTAELNRRSATSESASPRDEAATVAEILRAMRVLADAGLLTEQELAAKKSIVISRF